MVKCGRVVAILTKKSALSAQIHTVDATNHNLHGLAMMTRPKHYQEGAKNRKLATK